MSTALIVVDLQGDFIGGTLAVPDARAVVAPILAAAEQVDYVVFTRDYHPADHVSFDLQPKFVDGSWPDHCVKGTAGADIHPDVLLSPKAKGAPIFSKGQDPSTEEYSGFDGDFHGQPLADWLRDQDVTTNVVAGLATDYCVHATARDSTLEGFNTVVLADGIRGVNPVTTALAIYDLSVEYDAAFTEASNLDIWLAL